MNRYKNWILWTLLGTFVIPFSYFISMIVALVIHGSFGYSMDDDGTYLSNAIMHIASGAVLAFGTGFLQKKLLNKYIQVSYFWVLSIIIGFVLAEFIAGIILWKLEVYRGLINVFNADNHFPEAIIFAFAGFITGAIQIRLLKPYFNGRIYWMLSSTFGWGICILFTYFGVFTFFLGALFYGAITGFVLLWLLKTKDNKIET